ncbi:MAG: ribosome silencing factor [Gammaproteobacteria bacterium]|nr:ribosome silencing factor [Gammaproteobacteria bacterium]
MSTDELRDLVIHTLEEMKGQNILELDVREKTSITDIMVIVSGTSTRHVRGLAEQVALEAKKVGVQPLGTEGEREAEWVLVDLGDVVVHVMKPEVREFYSLEKLWSVDAVVD